MLVTKLVCSRCGKEYSPSENPIMCTTKNCIGRLDIEYDYEKAKEILTREYLESRRSPGKYLPLLPIEAFHVSLGESETPLIKSKRLAEKLG